MPTLECCHCQLFQNMRCSHTCGTKDWVHVRQYVTLRATRDQTAATAAKIIYDSIFMQYGCPRYITLDRGSSWLNELFQNFIKLGNLNIMHMKTSPYRPNCNGATELRNLHIIRHLRAYCDNTEEFDKFSPSIACGLRQ
jgi:hypothetical protein